MSWDEHAATWDDDPAVRAYSEAAFGSLEQLADARGLSLAGARVLDFGCGTGLLSERLVDAGAQVVALDLSEAMVAVLRGKELAGVQALSGELAALQQAAHQALVQPFDLVVASSVLAFVDNYPATVRRLVGLLRPGGTLVHWDWELDPTDDEPYGLSREAMASALAAAGLDQVQVDVGFHQPFEGMVMQPLLGVGRRR